MSNSRIAEPNDGVNYTNDGALPIFDNGVAASGIGGDLFVAFLYWNSASANSTSNSSTAASIALTRSSGGLDNISFTGSGAGTAPEPATFVLLGAGLAAFFCNYKTVKV